MIVFCRLPNAGLGNQLFSLMRSHVFASTNDADVIVLENFRDRLIGNSNNRDYSGLFKFQKSTLNFIFNWIYFFGVRLSRKCILNPKIDSTFSKDNDCYFLFDGVPHWDDYFCELKNYRNLIRDIFFDLISEDVLGILSKYEKPQIGLHVRMGDFKILSNDENFAEVGGVRTPLAYFSDVLLKLNDMGCDIMNVTVFSDGRDDELSDLLLLPRVSRFATQSALIDMLLLSQSDIIITSAGSTFSYWAGFLSDSILIIHPEHYHSSIRSEKFNLIMFEGFVEDQSKRILLECNIANILIKHR